MRIFRRQQPFYPSPPGSGWRRSRRVRGHTASSEPLTPALSPGRGRTLRAGNTLAEVLISLLAFGIGAVAVATLFPASVLQSLNATRLTKATIHRFNAEAMIDMFPMRLVHNPDNDGDVREHFNENYIVDPLGWHTVPAGIQGQFGNNGNNSLQRFRGGFNQTEARNLTILPDSWVPAFEEQQVVSAFTDTSATLSGISADDLAQISTGTPASRITLFDTTGRFSQTRIIDNIADRTVNWSTDLPPGFSPATASIETQEFQFSWLLTVRNRGEISPPDDKLNANVDVVVFFRRDFSAQSERVFELTQVGPRDYTITIPGGGPRPFLKKGAYLCDIVNARWYRIQKLTNETSNSPRIRLEHGPPVPETIDEAVFPQGVVEVYPLGVK